MKKEKFKIKSIIKKKGNLKLNLSDVKKAQPIIDRGYVWAG